MSINWGGITTYTYEVWEDGQGFYFTINAVYGSTREDPGDEEVVHVDEVIYDTYEAADAAANALYDAKYADDDAGFYEETEYEETHVSLMADMLMDMGD